MAVGRTKWNEALVDVCVQEVGDVELFVVICSPLCKVPGEFLESVQNTPSYAGSLTTGVVLGLNWAIESKKNVCMMVGIETTIND